MNALRNRPLARAALMGLAALLALTLLAMGAFSVAGGDAHRHRMALALLVGIGMLAALLGGIGWLYRRNSPIERYFLLLFVPLSLGMMIAMPVLRVPDETAHIQRTYQIATGQFVPQDGRFDQPGNLFETDAEDQATLRHVAEMFGRALDKAPVSVGSNESTGIYPITAYAPQALFMAAANLVSDNQGVLLYAARVGSWLITLLMFYAAIRLTPCGKSVMLVVSLLPMTLQEAASASADGMAIACVMLALAVVLRIREDRRVFRGALPLMCLSAVGLISFKVMYAPFLLLLLLLPAEAFSSAGKRRFFRLCALLCALLTLGLWAWSSLAPGAVSGSHAGQVWPQIQAALRAPHRFLALLGRTCLRYAFTWGWQMIGGTLSWFNIYLPHAVVVLWAVILLWTALLDRPVTRPGPVRAMAWGISLALFLMILCALYAWWTPADSPLITGVQGRYFLPCAAPVLISLSGVIRPRRATAGQVSPILYGAAACLGVCTILTVLSHTLS